MTLSELTLLFEEAKQEHGEDFDPEVRLAIQPSWPFECRLESVKLVFKEGETIDDLEAALEYDELTEDERTRLVEEVSRLREDNTPIIYLAQGTQMGYASADLWD